MGTMTLEALLMPLAQRIGDPRFDTLRGLTTPHGLLLDTRLGAIVRTVVACGMGIVELWRREDGQWRAQVVRHRGDTAVTYTCDTPEEAVARCLVALVGAMEEKEVQP